MDVDELLLFLTDPEQADSDFDGVNDYDEVFVEGTNPLLQDTDGDGLTDLLELETSGTDPLNPDTDMDGCNDALYFGMMCAGQGDNCEVDTNGDGIINVLDLVNISSFFGLICPF